MHKLLVFDWNGTLIADAQACMEACNYVFEGQGKEAMNLDTFRRTITMPVVEFYAIHGFERDYVFKQTEVLAFMFHDFYEKRAVRCRLRKGARILLHWLNKNSVQSIILSNHTEEGIRYHLERLDIASYFSHILANKRRDDTMHSLSKLQKLQEYLNLHSYHKEEVVIIGDSPEEIEIGKTTGISTVAITGGHYDTRRLKRLKPDFIINHLEEVKEIFNYQFSIIK